MTILVFIYGLIIGSFLNVCIYRIPRDESICFPASHCPKCGLKLNWYDNIPMLSYMILMGRCRKCDNFISLQYPIVELVNGLIYVCLYLYFGFTIDFIFYSLISSVLIIIAFIDLLHMVIPDSLILVILILNTLQKIILFLFEKIDMNLLDSLLGLLLSGGLFLIIYILSQGGMGDGDVTLIASLGFVLGLKKVILNILLSFFIGALISILLLVTKVKSRKDPIPFGPFMVISFFITLFYGSNIIIWYLNFF